MATNPFDSPHYKALSQLYPLKMDAEEYAVSKELDRALEYADAAYPEIFPSTATATLERWEDLYELGHTGTLEYRRQVLLAEINRESGIAERHYKALAAAIGFTIDIVKPPRMFRAGLSRAGFPVYDPDWQYTWIVKCGQLEESCGLLKRTLNEQKIPFTEIVWEFAPEGLILLENGGKLLTEDGHPLVVEEPEQV